MSEIKTYKVRKQRLLESRKETALCSMCNGELEFIEPVFYDTAKTIFMGFSHRCTECGHISILPFKYPMKIEEYEEYGTDVEYANIDTIYDRNDGKCIVIQ